MDAIQLQVVINIAAIPTTAFLASYFAFHRNKKDKQWEARYKAYCDILEAINSISVWATEENIAQTPFPQTGDIEKHRENFEAAKINLQKYINIGELTIKKEIIDLIIELSQYIFNKECQIEACFNKDDFDGFFKICEQISSKIDKQLPYIIKKIKKDL